MGVWKDKPERRLVNAALVFKRDMSWAIPFMKLICEKHERPPTYLVRKAFCVKYTDRPNEPFSAGDLALDKEFWKRIQFRIPERNAWLGEALSRESIAQDRSPSDVLFVAFSEVYGIEYPEYRKLYEKWKEVVLPEAA